MHYKRSALTTENYTKQNKINKSTSCTDRLFRNFQPNHFNPTQRVASKTYLLTKNNLFISSSAGTYLVLDTSQEESYNTGLFFTITDYSSPPALFSIISLSLSTDDCRTPQSAVMHVRQGEGAVAVFQWKNFERQPTALSDHDSSPCVVQRCSATFNWNYFGLSSPRSILLHSSVVFIALLY